MLLLDKIDLRLEGWYVLATPSEIQQMLGSLRDARSHGRPSVFNTPDGGQRSNRYTVAISARGGFGEPRLVFSGLLTVTFASSRSRRAREVRLSGDQNLYNLYFDLNINPTCFANYQPLEEVAPDLFRLRWDEPQLRRLAPRRPRTREIPLYNCDNYLHPRWHQAALNQRNDLTSHCINSIVDLLQSEMVAAASGVHAVFRAAPLTYNLQSAEVYLDALLEPPIHPIHFVDDLHGALRSHGLSSREQLYGNRLDRDAYQLNREVNARYFSAKIGNGREIAVYAKTSRRVRFEVKFDLTKNAWMLHRSGGSRAHKTSILSTLVSWLSVRLPTVAVGELERFFRHVRNAQIAYTNSPSAYLFLGRLAQCCGIHTQTVLTCLVRDRSIRLAGAKAPLSNCIRLLLANGIIEHVGSRRDHVYRPTLSYRQAINALAGLPMPPES